MILISAVRARHVVVAWTLLGVCVLIGCGRTATVTDEPPAKVLPKIKRLQDIKSKADGARK